jgi:PAS domain S-box-containing protein
MPHRSNTARYALAVVAAVSSAGAGALLQSTLGYRFPLITFYPTIMLAAWYGGFWPGVVATGVSTILVDYLWLAPLRNAHQGTIGDLIALTLFVGVGLLISGFSESLHRSTARERLARIRAEEREKALGDSEHRLRASETRLAADATALARLNALSSRLWRLRSRCDGLEEMLAATIELLGADMGNIQLLDAERGVLTIVAQRGFTKEFLDFFREVSTKDDSACGRTLRSGERTIIEDVEQDVPYAPLRPIARDAGYRAVQSTPLLDRDGKPLGMLSTHWRSVHRPTDHQLARLDLYARQAADFIDRCRTEDALHDSGRRLQQALEAGHMGTWEWSAAPGTVAWSNGLEAIHGLQPRTFAGTFEASQRDIHPDDLEQVRSSIARSLATGDDHHVEYRIIWPDGSVHWVEERGSVVKNNGGTPIGLTGICVDVTARKVAEDAIRDSERRFRTMADCAPVLIWISGTDKQCTWFNKRWLEFVNRTMDQEVGTGWTENVHSDDVERCVNTYVDAFDARQDFSMEYRLRRHDGEYRWILDNGIPTYGPNGEFTGYIGSCLDITERRQIEVELRNANRLKDEFLATLSHELRTPLNAVLGWAQMLRSGTLRAETKGRALESLERNARAQVQLVDDLLDMSGIISGKLHLATDAIDLSTVIADALDTARAAAAQKSVALEIDIERTDETTVIGDAIRLRQIVSNLVLNAVKFTPSGGGVQVSLVCRDSKAEIIVRDTGEGIGPQFLPLVFERFRQADAGTTRRHGGLGLGLAIVKHLTEAHGGTVTAESEGIGKGAIFTVSLPLRPCSSLNATETKRRRPLGSTTATLSGARVLAVDDECDARDLIRVMLETHGAHVSTVECAKRALHAIGDGKYDVLVADIGMPERDGFWLIRAIRQLPVPQRQIPAIAVTAYVSARERAMALEAGYDVHVAKPLDADLLVAAIARALRSDRNMKLSM